jgi:hypothetical protein
VIRGPRKWTETLIVRAIRRRRTEGSDLTYSRMLQMDPQLLSAAMRHLGGWRQAVEAAGFDYDLVRRVGKARRSQAIRRWTPQSISREIRRLWELGEDVRVSAVQARLPGLRGAARKQYPSWAHALRAAGVPSQYADAAAEARRGWKGRWLRRLRAQAAGLEKSAGKKPRSYGRAFRLGETASGSDWLDRLSSGAKR